jgi:coatomer protein complex subunit epsilon
MSRKMSQAADVDELFDVKNAYYTGSYQSCINEAQKLSPSDADISIDRDVYLYRSYLALKKFGVVRDEINGNSPTLLQPLKTLLAYLQSEENASRRENVVAEVEKQVQGGDGANTTSILVNASILYHEENYEMTLRVLHAAPSDHLESMALRLQTLLKMDRIDLAKKEVKSMQERDDDATLTQLAQAWVNMYMGGDKIQDAYYIYQELIDKHGSTPLLLNGQAASYIGQEKFDEAEAALQEAVEKDPNNVDTLINLIVLSQQTGKPPEVCNRYMTQLKDDHPHHQFVKCFIQKEQDFSRMAQQYAMSA